jgi:hypothetical protein
MSCFSPKTLHKKVITFWQSFFPSFRKKAVQQEISHADKHLASWAGVCPGNYESAVKQLI